MGTPNSNCLLLMYIMWQMTQISGLAKHTTVKELLKNLNMSDGDAQVTVKSGDKVLAENDVVNGGMHE